MGMIYVDDDTAEKLKSMGKPSQVIRELLSNGGADVSKIQAHFDERLDKLGAYLDKMFTALDLSFVDRLDASGSGGAHPSNKVYQGKFYDWEDVQKYWLNGPDNDPDDPAWANKMAARTMSESNDVPEVWEEVGEYIGYRNLEGQFFPIFKAEYFHI